MSPNSQDSGRDTYNDTDNIYTQSGPGHNSWVVGDEPYVSLHLMGGEDYAA